MTENEHPILVFAHANGFPAGSYRRFLDPLSRDYRIAAPEKLAHHADYPPAPNWSALADELLDFIAARTPEPVIGVGHSMGGVFTFLAALRQPRRFRAFVMLDPPAPFGPSAWFVAMAKRLGFVDRLTPAGRTAGRRAHWPDREQALAYFRSRDLFRNFDPRCLEDYVEAGTERTAEGLQLVYDPDREVAIYRNVPHDLMTQPAPVRVPGAIVVGSASNVTRRSDARRMARRHDLLVSEVDGGHMFPLEHPGAAAAHVGRVIVQLLDRDEVERRRSRGKA